MLSKKIIGLTVVGVLGFSSVSAYDLWNINDKININNSLDKANSKIDEAFKKVDTKMLEFEDKMDLFQKELDEKLELVWKKVEDLTKDVNEQLDKSFKLIEKTQEKINETLSKNLTNVIDWKLDKVFKSIETKLGSEKMIKSFDNILTKIDKLKKNEKFQSGKNKDLLNYIEWSFKKEQLNQAKKIVEEKTSDDKVSKEEFEEIDDLIKSLTKED